MTNKQRFQGEHWPRAARMIAGVWIAAVLGPGLARPRPVGQMLAGALLAVILLLLSELLVARRMGFTIAADGLTLHGLLGRRRLAWTDLQSFAWRRRRAFELLYAVTTSGRYVEIPSMQRGLSGWRARYLGSSRARPRDRRIGRADAFELLQDALAEARAASAAEGNHARRSQFQPLNDS